MLRLKVLGGLAVLREGSVLKGAATQRRRLALLAIIAISGKKGISRDRLLTLLWPESQESQGRRALAQSLYALRRDLGDDDLFLGTSELRLNPAAITSDVEDFRNAIDSGDLACAAAIYQGPLLDGVYVSEAPDFERWLDSERAKLTLLLSQSLESLASQQKEKGDLAAASATLARLAGTDGLNTRVVVKAIQSLIDSGDIAGALSVANRHEADRREELDLPADAEVLALREKIIRCQRHASTDAPTISAAESRNLPATEADSTAAPLTASSTRVKSHRPWYWIAGLTSVAIAATFLAKGAFSAKSGAPTPSRIAVLPFAVRGNARLAYLKDGMVDLLSQRLDGAGTLHTVDPNALLEFIRDEPAAESDLEIAKNAAAHFGAGQFVLGSIVDVGGRLQLSATIYAASGKRLSVATSTAADESHLLSLVDDLARGLVGGEMTTDDARLEHEAAITTASLPALKLFLKGEQETRAAHYPSAVDAYQRAIALDTTFALAWYRLSTVAEWSSQSKLVSEAIRNAVRFESKLSAEERLLLDARMASLDGNDDEVERLYHLILSSHPEDAEAWTQMGETVFHNGAWRGRPIGESRYAFERVAGLRPADVLPRLHLARLAALRDDRVALDTLMPSSAVRLLDPDQLLEFNAIQAFGSRDTARANQFVDSVERVSGNASFPAESALLAAWRIATFATNAAAAERLALTVTRTGNPAAMRISGFLAAAHMAAARGRWNESQQFLNAADAIDHAASVRARANIVASGLFPVSSSSLRRVISQLQSFHAIGPDASSHHLIDALLAGRLAIMAQNSGSLGRALSAMSSTLRSDPALDVIGRHFQNQLNARQAAADGKTEEALALVGKGWPRSNPQARYPWLQSESYSMAAARFFRARLLDETGRVADALPWYETIAEDQGYSTIYLAPSYLRRAVAEEKLGHPEKAAELYKRFLILWRDADVELQPQVVFARARLESIARQRHA